MGVNAEHAGEPTPPAVRVEKRKPARGTNQAKVMGWPAQPIDYWTAPTGKVDFSQVWLK